MIEITPTKDLFLAKQARELSNQAAGKREADRIRETNQIIDAIVDTLIKPACLKGEFKCIWQPELKGSIPATDISNVLRQRGFKLDATPRPSNEVNWADSYYISWKP